MLRSRQEKEQLVRKFEEIIPFLKTQKNFGWYAPHCDNDPVYTIYPDYIQDLSKCEFRPVQVNIKTGWHGEFIYYDDKGVHRIKEQVVEIDDDFRENCYKAECRH